MRNILHIVASVLMWCLFSYYWYVVGRRQITTASLQAIAILGLFTIVGLMITIWWIAHNKKLASRNRRSSAPPSKPELFDKDTIGRPIQGIGVEALRQAHVINISLGSEGQKIYEVADGVGI
ncbi:MAG: hypothetical protein ACI9UK_000474 [Candidatus Krumholzibacteriia bacterium]|jgi:hypothetical protein